MKKQFLLLTLLVGSFTLAAQEISITPTPTFQGVAELEAYNIFQVYLHNDTNEDINLSWRIVENTFPEEWGITLCDNVNCYGILPDNADLDPIAAADSAIMKIDVNPELVEGNGILRFFINETGAPTPYKELVFEITTGTTDTKDLFNGAVQIFPNPASEWVKVDNQLGFPLNVQLADYQGRLLRQAYVPSNDIADWQVSDLPKGTYFLRLESTHRVVIRTLVIQ